MAQPTAEQALKELREGNARFEADRMESPRTDAARLRETVEKGQHPFATVLTCSDSRVPAELLFDQGIGDLFIVRVAGNVCGPSEIASVEYGVSSLQTPLLVVLGHTHCGAVTAAATGAETDGHLPELLGRIQPAVQKSRNANPGLDAEALVPYVIEQNIWQSIDTLFRESPGTAELANADKLQVLGAIYHLETGRVEWLDYPNQQD